MLLLSMPLLAITALVQSSLALPVQDHNSPAAFVRRATYSVVDVDGGSTANPKPTTATLTIATTVTKSIPTTITKLTETTLTDTREKTVSVTATYLVVNPSPEPTSATPAQASQSITPSIAETSEPLATTPSAPISSASAPSSAAASSSISEIISAASSSAILSAQSTESTIVSASPSTPSSVATPTVVASTSESPTISSGLPATTASNAPSGTHGTTPIVVPSATSLSLGSYLSIIPMSSSAASFVADSTSLPAISTIGAPVTMPPAPSGPLPTHASESIASILSPSPTTRTYDNGQWHTTYAPWNATATHVARQAPARL